MRTAFLRVPEHAVALRSSVPTLHMPVVVSLSLGSQDPTARIVWEICRRCADLFKREATVCVGITATTMSVAASRFLACRLMMDSSSCHAAVVSYRTARGALKSV